MPASGALRPLLATAALVGVTALTALALGRATALRAAWPPEADTFYLPTAATMRISSLGHHELAADLVAARANVYFGTQLFSRAPQRWLSRYVHTALDLDPHFHRVYKSASAMLIYGGQKITVEAVEQANALLERGTKVFPYDWELYFYMGFNRLFELPGLVGEDDPRVAAWRQRGIEDLRRAALFDGVPPWLPSVVARMLTRRGSEDLAIRHLEQAYAVATSEEARAQLQLRLATLRGKQFLEQLEEERRKLRQAVETRYPYAPEAFSLLAGPRRDRSVDLAAPPAAGPTSPAAP